MSGDFVSETDPNYDFKGWKKYYNSYTKRGRFNFVVTTYGVVFGLVLLNKMFKKGKPIEDVKTGKK